jgi:hypothetical protein
MGHLFYAMFYFPNTKYYISAIWVVTDIKYANVLADLCTVNSLYAPCDKNTQEHAFLYL